MAVVTMKDLLEAGVHFGHQSRRWHPKMARYIYHERNGIYIIDLHQTLRLLEDAYESVREMAVAGGSLLFVGTKRQAQTAVQENAERSVMPYVDNRWLGGMLTNFQTIKQSIDRLKKLERMQADGSINKFPKKEILSMERLIAKLQRNLGGIKDMERLPGAMFVIDPRRERIAVAEARRLNIPVVAVVDTNCDPDDVDYIIPGNDDAIRAIRLMASRIADAAVEGRQHYDEQAALNVARAAETGEQVESQPYVADTPPGEFPRPAGGPEVIIVQHDREADKDEDDTDEMDD